MQDIKPTHITHLFLLRKYKGKIMAATTMEMRAAAANIPKGKNALKHLFEALRLHKAEVQHLTK